MGSHFIYIKGLTKALKIAGHWDELQKKIVCREIVDKIYETMSRNQAKLDRNFETEYWNFDICF